VYTSTQSAEQHDGPWMPPDIIADHDVGVWAVANNRVQEHTRCHVNSKSTRVLGGQHYALGCSHLEIPDSCWTIDPLEHPFIDVIVDIAPIGSGTAVISILDSSHDESRYCHMDGHDLLASLEVIGERKSRLRREAAVGMARKNTGDVGTTTMHAIGTRVLLDGMMTAVGFAENNKMPQPVLRSFVEAFATVGLLYCFPGVLSVVQNVQADSSLVPIAPMDGNGKGLRVGYT
jgi:hypothetical protein